MAVRRKKLIEWRRGQVLESLKCTMEELTNFIYGSEHYEDPDDLKVGTKDSVPKVFEEGDNNR